VPSLLREDASELYANNQYNLLVLMMKENVIRIDWDDEVLTKTFLTHAGDHGSTSRSNGADVGNISFSVGAARPLLTVIRAPESALAESVAAASLLFVAFLGAVGARTGGANIPAETICVAFWGALAMAMTAGIGALFGTAR
jgi:VIT1/CCC1 family predicted Fe2+/Mn2+ transporter